MTTPRLTLKDRVKQRRHRDDYQFTHLAYAPERVPALHEPAAILPGEEGLAADPMLIPRRIPAKPKHRAINTAALIAYDRTAEMRMGHQTALRSWIDRDPGITIAGDY